MQPLNDTEINKLLRPLATPPMPIHLRHLKGHQPRTATSQSDLADYSHDEVEFMMAMERYMREHGRPFPMWQEVLAVARSLGWQKS